MWKEAEGKRSTKFLHHFSPSDSKPITPLSSLSLKSVFLYDWWLVRAEDGGLAVSGFASRDRLGTRLFCSAAIAKRHEATTLEAKDGIIITISGFINRSRTHQNGFPFEICNRFLLGFPYFWEQDATQCHNQESSEKTVHIKKSGSVELNKSSGINATSCLPISFGNLPVTRIQDLLMHSLGEFEDSAFNDILGQLCGNSFKHTPTSAHSDVVNRSPVATSNAVMDESPQNHKRAKVNQNHKDVDEISNAVDTTLEECVNPSVGVVTRGMSRLRNLKKMEQENLSLNSTRVCKNSKKILDKKPSSNSFITSTNSTSEASKNQLGGMVTRSALKRNPASIAPEEVMEAPDTYLTGRSRARRKS